MNQIQKHAWFNIAVIAAAVLAMILIGYLWNWKGAWGGMGFMGFMGFSPVFYRKRGGQKPIIDERDQLIQLRSYLASFVITFAIAFPGIVLFAFLYGIERSMPVIWLPLSIGCLGMVWSLVWSLIVLVQYRGEES